jgi:low affinity Fe/Cu permease
MSRRLIDRFVDAADRVSYAIGTPQNIGIWFVLLVAWTLLGPVIAKSSFLPVWFTSNSWNFPLNTVTTILELFIGFLIAASNNRQERSLELLLQHIGASTDESLADERQELATLASLAEQLTALTERLAVIEQQTAPVQVNVAASVHVDPADA